MSQRAEITFHNVLPTRAMIDRALQSADKPSPQIEMAKAILDFASSPDGRKQFGDPESGSTLEQIWRLRLSSTGTRLVCLVDASRDDWTTNAIPNVVRLSTTELVDTIARVLDDHRGSSVHPFVFDGERGYAITLLNFDASMGAFTIREPDPKHSKIGATATEGGSWVLTKRSLEDSICAVFLPPPAWAQLTGVPYAIPYSTLTASELWSFFGIRELHRDQVGPDHTIVYLEPGGFKKENRMQVRLDKTDRVRGAVLLQARPWLMNQSTVNPFALDLAKSFVQHFTPEPDDTSDVIAGIWALKSMEELSKLEIAPSSEVGLFLQSYLGTQAEAWILKDFVKLQAKTIELDNIKFMQLQMDHW